MKEETKVWLKYSEENFDSAKILLKSKLFNPCLQNVQQTVEKALKAVLIDNDFKFKKTHDILELRTLLSKKNIDIDISDEDCDFLNSIYLPSKYPLGSVIPHYEPDESICKRAVNIATNVSKSVSELLI
ncbi:MAG: HEPN domain-containing protein [Deltaproteobacteria bacterium]|nr:HEPN domain-containing protein [Deltaproteobacteria bacterium]